MTAGSNRYRTIWLSDLHFGSSACKAQFLLDFIRCNEADYLYLVSDIIDEWALRRSWHWPQRHNDIVQKLLHKARKGTQVVYIPGNHDEFARDYTGLRSARSLSNRTPCTPRLTGSNCSSCTARSWTV